MERNRNCILNTRNAEYFNRAAEINPNYGNRSKVLSYVQRNRHTPLYNNSSPVAADDVNDSNSGRPDRNNDKNSGRPDRSASIEKNSGRPELRPDRSASNEKPIGHKVLRKKSLSGSRDSSFEGNQNDFSWKRGNSFIRSKGGNNYSDLSNKSRSSDSSISNDYSGFINRNFELSNSSSSSKSSGNFSRVSNRSSSITDGDDNSLGMKKSDKSSNDSFESFSRIVRSSKSPDQNLQPSKSHSSKNGDDGRNVKTEFSYYIQGNNVNGRQIERAKNSPCVEMPHPRNPYMRESKRSASLVSNNAFLTEPSYANEASNAKINKSNNAFLNEPSYANEASNAKMSKNKHELKKCDAQKFDNYAGRFEAQLNQFSNGECKRTDRYDSSDYTFDDSTDKMIYEIEKFSNQFEAKVDKYSDNFESQLDNCANKIDEKVVESTKYNPSPVNNLSKRYELLQKRRSSIGSNPGDHVNSLSEKFESNVVSSNLIKNAESRPSSNNRSNPYSRLKSNDNINIPDRLNIKDKYGLHDKVISSDKQQSRAGRSNLCKSSSSCGMYRRSESPSSNRISEYQRMKDFKHELPPRYSDLKSRNSKENLIDSSSMDVDSIIPARYQNAKSYLNSSELSNQDEKTSNSSFESLKLRYTKYANIKAKANVKRNHSFSSNASQSQPRKMRLISGSQADVNKEPKYSNIDIRDSIEDSNSNINQNVRKYPWQRSNSIYKSLTSKSEKRAQINSDHGNYATPVAATNSGMVIAPNLDQAPPSYYQSVTINLEDSYPPISPSFWEAGAQKPSITDTIKTHSSLLSKISSSNANRNNKGEKCVANNTDAPARNIGFDLDALLKIDDLRNWIQELEISRALGYQTLFSDYEDACDDVNLNGEFCGYFTSGEFIFATIFYQSTRNYVNFIHRFILFNIRTNINIVLFHFTFL